MTLFQSSAPKSVVWLTPQWIIEGLGGADSFDFDPCAAPEPRPWPTARHMNGRADGNGLRMPWHGRVWLNPPYSRGVIDGWLARMADHDRGTALILARTETEAWRKHVWGRAAGILFLYGRLRFYRPNGAVSTRSVPAPAVLVAYGDRDFTLLAQSGIAGKLVPLNGRTVPHQIEAVA